MRNDKSWLKGGCQNSEIQSCVSVLLYVKQNGINGKSVVNLFRGILLISDKIVLKHA
jgi:hypothetical protein